MFLITVEPDVYCQDGGNTSGEIMFDADAFVNVY